MCVCKYSCIQESYQFNHFSCSVMSDSVTPWTSALSVTNSQSLLRLMSTKLVMPSNHLVLYCPLLLLPSIFPSIRVFSNESALHIRWPKYWRFSFSISLSNEYSGLISFRIERFDLLAVGSLYMKQTPLTSYITLSYLNSIKIRLSSY